MMAHQRSALATLAVAAALAVAACGSTPGSAASPPGNAATTPPANLTPESFSGPSPQENNPFPYDPGGVTFNGGLAGGLLTFSIPAGPYSLNVQASYDQANDPSGSGQCLFDGELDYLSGGGGTEPLGGTVPIISSVPFHLGPLKGNYAAGNYKIYIYPETTCSWTVELWF
jgi:hypothetical protein